MKIDWRVELPALALLSAMLIAGVWAWPGAPERIPVHWNLSGEVDRYGGRFEGLFGLPLIACVLYVLMLVFPRIDPGRANYASFAGVYVVLRLAILSLLAALTAIVHLTIRGQRVSMASALPVLMGALFVVIGGLMGKLRPNWFVGIRTPWTLSSKVSWTRTHRLAGWLVLVSGLSMLAATPAGPRIAQRVMIGSMVLTSVISVAYSYFVWRTDADKLPPAGSLPVDEAETGG